MVSICQTDVFGNPDEKSAVFSECRKYRYELWRRWSARGYCMFIGLNPSTADENRNDPTVRRCIDFSQTWGFGALCMTNLFSFRATDPLDMLNHDEPVGKNNDSALERLSQNAAMIVAAWGTIGNHQGRAARVMGLLKNPVYCLKVNKDGTPAHPLYIKSTTELIPYR